jgi:hypothetical protein
MSVDRENVVHFAIDSKGNILPVEAELALVVGAIDEHLQKSGLFKRVKEQLRQVSKFYWKVYVEQYQNKLFLVDSQGYYGDGKAIFDLSLAQIEDHIQAMRSANTINAYFESLQKANHELILEPIKYPVFEKETTKSAIQLIQQRRSQDMIDKPLVLPSYEQAISEDFLVSQHEIERMKELITLIKNFTDGWIAEIDQKLNEISGQFDEKINRLEGDIDQRISNYEDRLETIVKTNTDRANAAISKALEKFESSTMQLTGLITPLQKEAQKIRFETPQIDSPNFQAKMQKFLSTTNDQIGRMSGQVKNVDNERKQLAKLLNNITKQLEKDNQQAREDLESRKASAYEEVDDLHIKKDESVANLKDMKETIKRSTKELVNKIENAIKHRKEMADEATTKFTSNIPKEAVIALYLVRLQEKDEARYYVIPPLKKAKGLIKNPTFPLSESDSAIENFEPIVNKIAEELVFSRRLKPTFDALKTTNYVATGEFAGAVQDGLTFLTENKLLGGRSKKKILDLLDNLLS